MTLLAWHSTGLQHTSKNSACPLVSAPCHFRLSISCSEHSTPGKACGSQQDVQEQEEKAEEEDEKTAAVDGHAATTDGRSGKGEAGL